MAKSLIMSWKSIFLVKPDSMVNKARLHNLSWQIVVRSWFFTLFKTENDRSPSELAAGSVR